MNATADANQFNTLLERSETFEEAITACFPEVGFVPAVSNQQHELAATACILCIEHASVFRAAFAIDAPNSGSAMLRLQFEALLRAAWLLYAATPEHINKLGRVLAVETEQAAKNLPGYMEMLDAVVKKAPQELSAPIAEFNHHSRHALNSFVHSGIHPLRRAREGYPLEMAVALLRSSNGLMHFAYRMLASLSGSERRMNRVTALYKEFTDSLPMAESVGTSNEATHPPEKPSS